MDAFRSGGLTLRQAALTAGFAYLLNAVPYAEFSIFPRLVVPGNAQQTVANLTQHQGLFAVAILCYLLNFIEDIIIAWALFALLAPVNRSVSLLAALFRLVYTAVALSGMLKLVTVYRMIATPAYMTNFGATEFRAQIDLLIHMFRYEYAFAIGAIFSIHLVLIGYLIFRSRYMPSWLGVLIVINGFGWAVTNLRPYLYPNANVGFLFVTYFGEIVLMLWLLIRGWTLKDSEAPSVTAPAWNAL